MAEEFLIDDDSFSILFSISLSLSLSLFLSISPLLSLFFFLFLFVSFLPSCFSPLPKTIQRSLGAVPKFRIAWDDIVAIPAAIRA